MRANPKPGRSNDPKGSTGLAPNLFSLFNLSSSQDKMLGDCGGKRLKVLAIYFKTNLKTNPTIEISFDPDLWVFGRSLNR